jgi:hypothetical protein
VAVEPVPVGCHALAVPVELAGITGKGNVGTMGYIPRVMLFKGCRGGLMESSAPAGQAHPDLLFAWMAATSIDVRALAADDEQSAQEALSEHPQPGRVRELVRMLVEKVEADPARLQAAAAAARSRCGELASQGEPPQRLRPYLVAAALAVRGLAVIEEAAAGNTPDVQAHTEQEHAGKKRWPASGRKVAWVMRLPPINPPFAEDQRWRDGCMMAPLSWRQRVLRQVFPRRGVRDCCYYHRQDFHAIAAAVNAIHRQLRRSGLDGDDADELMFRLLDGCGLSEDEHSTAMLLLAEDCGIQISRSPGERRWTYDGGRHRARALMDAGVHRIIITVTDDRRSRD